MCQTEWNKNAYGSNKLIMKSLYLLDALPLLYRAYYSRGGDFVRDKEGRNTTAILYFIDRVLHLLEKKTTHIAVVFPALQETVVYGQPLHPEIRDSVAPVKELLAALRIPVLGCGRDRVCDVIGSLARQAVKKEMHVTIVSPDNYYAQLAAPAISLYKPAFRGKPEELLDEAAVKVKWKISRASKMVELLALSGEPAMAIRGRMSEASASKTINESNDLGRLSEWQHIIAQLTINTKLRVALQEQALTVGEPDKKSLAALFTKWEFYNLGRRLLGAELVGVPEKAVAQEAQPLPTPASVVNTPEAEQALRERMKGAAFFAFKTKTTAPNPHLCAITGFIFAFDEECEYEINITDGASVPLFVQEAFENEECLKIAYDIKFDILVLHHAGVTLKGYLFDVMLAQFAIAGRCRNTGANPAALLLQKGKLEKLLKERQCEKLFYEVEMPLVRVLASIETEGINIDLSFIEYFTKHVDNKIADCKSYIYKQAKKKFNLDSPEQLGDVLFRGMKIPYDAKKTDSGRYATNESVLSVLEKKYPVVQKVLEYRGWTKIKTTYMNALAHYIHPVTKRIHTSLNQAVASTGRLSSSSPNLQNIPIRTDEASEIRKAFIARSNNHVLLSADYSQIELRVMAALSKDKGLLQAFKEGLDIHAATAARIYNVPIKLTSREMRSNAKMVNFGLMFGMSAAGLSKRTGMTRKEATVIIDQYFTEFSGIRQFMDSAVDRAKQFGYAETIMGRRHYLPDIHSKTYALSSLAKRNAINTPIQGSAADLIKVAMIKIHAELQKRKLQSKMILQIHDELLFDVVKTEMKEVRELVEDCMKTALPLPVPIVIDIGVGRNWLEAHKL